MRRERTVWPSLLASLLLSESGRNPSGVMAATGGGHPVVDQATRPERSILANVPVGQLLLSLGAEGGTLRHRLCLDRGHGGRIGGTRDCEVAAVDGGWGKPRQAVARRRPGGTA